MIRVLFDMVFMWSGYSVLLVNTDVWRFSKNWSFLAMCPIANLAYFKEFVPFRF